MVPASRRVLLIAFDAAEPDLVERWLADGCLPNLRRLRQSGRYGRLASSARWLSGSPWPTFFTGRSPADHGIYEFLQWRAERMEARRPTPEWLPARPFWRDLGREGRRAIVIDVPSTYRPEPFDGLEISGFASHDFLAPPCSYPPDLMNWARRKGGSSPLGPEIHRHQSPRELLDLRDRLCAATERVGALAEQLMRGHDWDLFALAFGATHRGGHKLWDQSSAEGTPSEAEADALKTALKEVYIACDRALGRLVECAGPGVTVLVCSMHGMGPNTSRVAILPEMLARTLDGGVPDGVGESGPKAALQRIRHGLPAAWRSGLKAKLPLAVQDRLSAFWRVDGVDWRVVRAQSLIADHQGYIRINRRGREVQGTVEPGAAYDALCARIADGLLSFVDADTGAPVVDEVVRADRLFPAGERLDRLPDLIVRWSDSPACRHRAVRSPHFGTLAWPAPGKNPDARSGNHRAEGFLLARGPGIDGGGTMPQADILDLAPCVRALLGLAPDPAMAGAPLAALMPAVPTDA
ncbi:MAG: alkaline phosphatase family protein [Geminicoccaceae bacterium]